MFQTLRDEGINIKVITTSEIKVSVLIDRKYMELAVQALHDAFGLERAGHGLLARRALEVLAVEFNKALHSGIVGALATFGPFQIQEGRRFRVRHCFTTH
jgi:hypothetical protein